MFAGFFCVPSTLSTLAMFRHVLTRKCQPDANHAEDFLPGCSGMVRHPSKRVLNRILRLTVAGLAVVLSLPLSVAIPVANSNPGTVDT